MYLLADEAILLTSQEEEACSRRGSFMGNMGGEVEGSGMISDGQEEDILEAVWTKVISPLERPNEDLSETAKSLGVLVTVGFLALALLFNVTIIFSILCGPKKKVGYFLLFAFLLFFNLIFCLLSSLHSCLPFILPETDIPALKTFSTFIILSWGSLVSMSWLRY